MPKTSIDSAVAAALNLDPSNASVSSAGGGGMSSASTARITATLEDGTEKQYFMKTGKGSDAETMFAGEHASLSAIHNSVPTLCPQSFGHGQLKDTPGKSFLVTDFLDLSAGRKGNASGDSLAEKLAKLHTTPAPPPPDSKDGRPTFGFPVTTCCGDMPQPNPFTASWADFYANSRLRFIASASAKSNGKDAELDKLIERTCTEVVPRLIGDEHLNGGKGVMPVVVHGDLWGGNASVGKLPGMTEPEEIVFDPSACYAHSEFELGIMKMFGGFGGSFLKEYHSLCPKTDPSDEHEDRVALYELYHHLNHHALFGGGYRGGAVSIMKSLLKKYGGREGKTEL